MAYTQRETIEFPANPFVAFADFLTAVLLVLLLAFVCEALFINNMLERLAFQSEQDSMRALMTKDTSLAQAFNAQPRLIVENRDGDLQRFWFDDSLYFSTSAQKEPYAVRWATLIAFGRVLASQQGDINDPRTRPFKRILVEGHSDVDETYGPQKALIAWKQASDIALAAASVLEKDGHVCPGLIVISARGAWDQNIVPKEWRLPNEQSKKASLGIVLVYSG